MVNRLNQICRRCPSRFRWCRRVKSSETVVVEYSLERMISMFSRLALKRCPHLAGLYVPYVTGPQNAMMCAMAGADYRNIDHALQRVDSNYEAADCHGVICGVLAVDDALSRSLWMDEVMVVNSETKPVSAESRLLLNELFAITRDQLYGTDLSFIPLLPDDRVALRERVRALRKWCEGFTYGLALAGVHKDTLLPEDVVEIIKDLSEIAKAEVDDDIDEQDELAYVELVEYIKVSVLLTREELQITSVPAPIQ